MAPSILQYLRSQLFTKLPYPTRTFENQTIIITGSNTGMGLEAARHFYRLQASRVILAVRSLSSGLAAKKHIESTPNLPNSQGVIAGETSETRLGVVEVWELDLAKYDSVRRFAERAERELDRLNVVVGNAGIYTSEFRMAEKDEMSITVNVVSTMLLGILLLPKLRSTSVQYGKEVVLTFTGSFVHVLTTFPERKAENIFAGLAVEKEARMNDWFVPPLHSPILGMKANENNRYNVSKLIEILYMRALATAVTHSTQPGQITISALNPGFVRTSIMRESTSNSRLFSLFLSVLQRILSRTPEEGARTIIHAAEGRRETHGQYLDDCRVGELSPFMTSAEGKVAQEKVWRELGEKLEGIVPGVMGNI